MWFLIGLFTGAATGFCGAALLAMSSRASEQERRQEFWLEVEREIERHERWLGTEGADHLFDNGKGE